LQFLAEKYHLQLFVKAARSSAESVFLVMFYGAPRGW
jgi:hypothetical protein